jgi:hypothetical protein
VPHQKTKRGREGKHAEEEGSVEEDEIADDLNEGMQQRTGGAVQFGERRRRVDELEDEEEEGLERKGKTKRDKKGNEIESKEASGRGKEKRRKREGEQKTNKERMHEKDE